MAEFVKNLCVHLAPCATKSANFGKISRVNLAQTRQTRVAKANFKGLK